MPNPVEPLDLQAVEARHQIYLEGGYLDDSAEDVFALLAHCRALRAVAARADKIAYERNPVEWMALGECIRDFHALLRLARDEEAPREADPQ